MEAVDKQGGGHSEGEGDAELETERLTEEKGKKMMNRKEKRKAMKKMKRKQTRKETALKEREEEEAMLNDPQELVKIRMMEEEEASRSERERKLFEERERAWIEAMEIKMKEQIQQEEEEEEEELSRNQQVENANDGNEDDDWEYVEEGPAEIIWQGNEIIVKKKRVKVPKRNTDQKSRKEDPDRPTSNPLPPQSEAFADYTNSSMSAQQLIENVAQQVPHFGTEQDKAHCPFHLKIGACRFGQRCSRVHFCPDKSSTLLIKNMYNGPGLAWEQDEGLEYTDEEVERCYEEFYEDVHTEFLKFGEIINFKVCRNGSFHLRGNVYIHYKSVDSAVLAHQSVNGRYFAGKQISCDFINLTRWKVALCGQYMKSRYKTCSHGTACNFIHCFRNPGGDYEWADSDRPPPKYWVRKMVALFGYFDADEKQMVEENYGQLRNSSKMSVLDSERYVMRRSRSRERDYSSFIGSGRRYDNENYVIMSTGHRRCTGDDKHHGKAQDEDICDENKNLKDYHHRKNRKCDTEFDGELLDRKMVRDGHHDRTRKSSRRPNRDHKNNTYETEDDGGMSDRECNRVAWNEYRNQKNKNHEVDRDWLERDKDRDAYHDNTRSSRHKRKERCQDNHKDGKKRAHDTDGEWSDSNRKGDEHYSKRKSLGHITKASKWSDHRDRTTRSCSTEFSDDLLRNGADRHPSHARKRSKYLDEMSDISDGEGVPAQNLKHRHGRLSIEMRDGDSFVKNLESDRARESSNLEPEHGSVQIYHNSERKAGSSESCESGRPGSLKGRDESSDCDSELYSYDKFGREDGCESDKVTQSKHQKSRRKSTNNDCKHDSGNRSRGSSQSRHRRHSSSLEEAPDSSGDNKESGRKHHKRHHAVDRYSDHRRHHKEN